LNFMKMSKALLVRFRTGVVLLNALLEFTL
jgi:hypothetical protein